MNWGKGIAIVMSCFIIFITVLVIGFISHKVDLESEDYYQKELMYGDEIVALENAIRFDQKIEIHLTDKHIVIQQPEGMPLENVYLSFQRPNNQMGDVHFEITNERQFNLERSTLSKGVYNVSVSYVKAGKKCLQKEQIYL